MATRVKMVSNMNGHFVSTKLLSVYDTTAEPPHLVGLLDKKVLMNCLLVTLDGEGFVKTKKQEIRKLQKNSIYFGSINNMDCLYCNQKWHYLCYWFESFGKEFPFDVSYNEEIDIEKELKDVQEIMDLISTSQDVMIDQANALFTHKIISLLNKTERYKTTSNVFEKMLLYINKHLQDCVSVGEIAKEFGYSKKHIYYLFKKTLNISPGEFIDKMKLEHICALLLTNSYSLSELAEMYNYSSSSHLIYNFKKVYGCTPKQYQLDNN